MGTAPVIALLVAISVAVVLHLASMAIVGAAVGLAPTHVKLGFGPRLFSMPMGNLRLDAHAFPLGGHVHYQALEGAGLSARIATALSGCAALLVVGAALSPMPWGHAVVWPFATLSSAIQYGLSWGTLWLAAQASPWLQLFAATSLLLGAINLLPAPPLNGGLILSDLLARLGVAASVRGAVGVIGAATVFCAAGLAVAGGSHWLFSS